MQEPLFRAMEGLPTAVLAFNQASRLIWANVSGLELLQLPTGQIPDISANSILNSRLGLKLTTGELMGSGQQVLARLFDGSTTHLKARATQLETAELSETWQLLYLDKVSQVGSPPDDVFRAILENSLDLVAILDESYIVKFVAPSAIDLLGLSREEILGKPLKNRIAHQDQAIFTNALSTNALNTSAPPQSNLFDLRIRHSSGEERVFETRSMDLRQHPSIGGFLILARDISHRRKAEMAMRESQLRYRRLFEQSRDIVSITDRDGKLIDVNQAGVDLLGYDNKEQILNMDIGLAVWENPAARKKFFCQAQEHGYAEIETIFLTRTREQRLISGTMVEMRDDQGQPEGYLAIVRDVTEQRQIEDQLRQSQKMEAIGRLAGGIAHDFNNLLTAINGYCDLLLDEILESETRSYVREIEAAGNRASDLTAKLLTLSRREEITRKAISLNAAVKDLQGLLRRLIGEDIELAVDLSQDAGFVEVDPSQLDQAILNLAANARDAMPQGGRITLRTETREATAPVSNDQTATPGKAIAPRRASAESGSYATLSVIDTGVGMDAKTLQHIYEPFFTTKEAGKGTGLGLATVYATMLRFGGSIEVASEPGKGSTFSLSLPRIEAAENSSTHAADDIEIAKGSETILLVEDDDTVRHLVTTQLRRQGYTVITAEDGNKALGRIVEMGNELQLDLLISDVVMPGMSGPELAAELQRSFPTLPILFISGYTGSFMVQHGFCEETDQILQKPFTAKMLAERVRFVLDGTL